MNATAAGVNAQVQPGAAGALAASRRSRRWITGILCGALLAPILLAALWPVTFDSREELFEIPEGTWARRMAGEKHEVLPSEIRLMVGAHDVLTLKNSDKVPQMFGPTLLMPGQTFRLPFSSPSENYFACTAHASGKLLVTVEAMPAGPLERLSWRFRRLLRPPA